jgi:hypothetical protein
MADNLALTITGSDGTVYSITGAVTNATVVKTSPVVVPPPPVGPVAPTIPATAKVIDCLPLTWSAAQDPATNPGKASATGTTSYPVTFNGSTGLRQFNFTLGNRGGILFHCNPVADASAYRNFVLEFDAEYPDPTNIACLETDLNWVDNSGTGANKGKGAVTIIGQQLAGWDNCAEITSVVNGACHWNKTAVTPADPRTWAKGSRHKVRWFAQIDGKGNVTYEGVEIDGTYHLFTGANVQSSLDLLNWTANLLNAQLQLDGSSTGSVASVVYAHAYTVSCW